MKFKKYLIENNITNNIYGKNVTYSIIKYLFKNINNMFPEKHITPHTFRHTRAVHLLDKGVNPVYIQELLGHVSINTTMEYAKIMESSKFEAIEKASTKIDRILPDWNDDPDLLSQLLNM